MTAIRSIAVAQTVAVPGDVDANLDQHVLLAHQAAEAGAQVVVFPELSLTGYEIGLAQRLAFARHDPRLALLIGVASARAITLIVGAPVRLDSGLHIGAFIATPDGRVELYTKHHLGAFSSAASCDGVVPPAEATVFRPGDRNPLISFGGTTAAVAICADTGRPSHPRA
ncbi:MAG TPA: carbon-nitrogen hydrolase family protein, partial [Gemmatimonadales bacterium]|nr:carbon-nitrogen hydrolase family protein [Gemmatimonadales bacterium]